VTAVVLASGFFGSMWDALTRSGSWATFFSLAAIFAFAGCGEWIAERAGTINISLEGMILAGHFAAAIVFDKTHNMIIGIVVAMLAGLMVAAVQANLSHRLTADQFVVGLTLIILVQGLATFLNSELGLSGDLAKASTWSIPLLSDIPGIGPALFVQEWPFFLVFPAVGVAWWLVFRTRWGLEDRAVGEDPQAADVSGIHVNRRRRQAIYADGLFGGLCGAYLLYGLVGSFEPTNVGGRGIIAIAAVIFGGWTLRGMLAGSLLFGITSGLKQVLPAVDYKLNDQLLQALPYLAALFVMAFFAHRTKQPGSLARPFVRGLK
jgi:simple sugar transport system permease protein